MIGEWLTNVLRVVGQVGWTHRGFLGWMDRKMSNYTFFDDAEITKWQLDGQLWAMLDLARGKAGVPFVITSGRRSADGNSILAGAVPDSSHLTGLGVDIFVQDDNAYCLILKGLYAAGFRRFGHYFSVDQKDPNHFIPRHIHVDIDSTKPQDCCWAKREQN